MIRTVEARSPMRIDPVTYNRPGDEYTGPYPKPYDDVPGAPPRMGTATVTDPAADYRPLAGAPHSPYTHQVPSPYQPPGPMVGGPRRRRRRRGRKLALLVLVGGVVLVGAVGSSGRPSRAATVAVVETFTAVDINLPAGAVDVRYGDVDGARINVRQLGGGEAVHQTVDNGVLRITGEPSGAFGSRRTRSVDIILPRGLQSKQPRLHISTGAGDVEVSGGFDNVNLSTKVGSIEFRGNATETVTRSDAGSVQIEGRIGAVDAQSSAGSVNLRLADATTAKARSFAGNVDVRVSGRQPNLVEAHSSAGRVEVDVPDGRYRVDTSGTIGRTDIGITNDPLATQTVHASSQAGSVRVR